MDDLKVKYNAQKGLAKTRGIDFDLSFDEWKDIWDGNFHRRGVGKDKLGMLRTRDEGGYSIGNVRLGTPKENMQEAAVANSVSKAQFTKSPNFRKMPPAQGSWLFRDAFKPYVEEDEEY